MTASELIVRRDRAKATSTPENPVSATIPSESSDMPDAYAIRRGEKLIVHHLDPFSDFYERKIFERMALIDDPDQSFNKIEFKVRVGLTSLYLVDADVADVQIGGGASLLILWR